MYADGDTVHDVTVTSLTRGDAVHIPMTDIRKDRARPNRHKPHTQIQTDRQTYENRPTNRQTNVQTDQSFVAKNPVASARVDEQDANKVSNLIGYFKSLEK